MTDRSGETSRFDPRFDPAFQPGYDGAATRPGPRSDGAVPGRGPADAAAGTLSDRPGVGERGAEHRGADRASTDRAAADRATTDRATADRASTDRAFADQAKAEQRIGRFPTGLAASGSGPRPPGPPLPHAQTSAGPDASREMELAESDGTPTARSTNPFILALWVASALMVFGGVGLFQSVGQLTAEAQRTGSAPYDYFLVQSLIFGAPLLMVLGVATATGILFVHAVRWRTRK